MSSPETSKEAKDLKTNESKQRDYERIAAAFRVIGVGHYEDAANQIGEKDLNVCSRRFKEMREMGILENTGIKKLTSRNRNAFIHKLCDNPQKPAEKPSKPPKPKKTPDGKFQIVSSYKRRITKPSTQTGQKKLF